MVLGHAAPLVRSEATRCAPHSPHLARFQIRAAGLGGCRLVAAQPEAPRPTPVRRVKARIGVIVYTHDRVDDARINLEILRNLWPRHFGALTIIHCYNGDRRWYPRPYLEDELIRRPNPGHFEGAADLLDAGMRRMQRHKGIRFVVGLAADTWLLKPEYVRTAIEVTAADRLPWATS